MATKISRTPVQAIRAKCLDCSGGECKEVKDCLATDCPLFPYRMGQNPNCKPRQVSEDQSDAKGPKSAS